MSKTGDAAIAKEMEVDEMENRKERKEKKRKKKSKEESEIPAAAKNQEETAPKEKRSKESKREKSKNDEEPEPLSGIDRETKEKKRLVILLILLTVVFFLAFIPYGIMMILNFNKIRNKNTRYLQHFAQYLTLLSCSVNPFIYAFQSSSYRRSFLFLMKKIFRLDTTVDATKLLEMRTRTSLRTA